MEKTQGIRCSRASQPIEPTGAALCPYSETVYAQFCSFKDKFPYTKVLRRRTATTIRSATTDLQRNFVHHTGNDGPAVPKSIAKVIIKQKSPCPTHNPRKKKDHVDVKQILFSQRPRRKFTRVSFSNNAIEQITKSVVTDTITYGFRNPSQYGTIPKVQENKNPINAAEISTETFIQAKAV